MTATFRAMTTDVALVAPTLAPDAEARLAVELAASFERAERTFSRFRPDSELARLNASRGPVAVSDALFDVLCRARAHVARTGGAFDPGVGAAVIAAGYDRSFAPGALDRDGPPAPAAPRGSLLDVDLDPRGRRVTRPPGMCLDLGGIVKGATVDAAAARLPAVAALDAGGDAVLRGAGPDGEGWIVDIEDPSDAARLVLSLRLRDVAVATSAPNRRRWRVGARVRHHLVDPRTGDPATSDLAQATVVASSAELADVLAKAAFVLGAREGARLVRREGAAAVLVRTSGEVVRVGDLEVIGDA